MLYTQKLLAELERKREQLEGYQNHYGAQLAAFRAALAALATHYPSASRLSAAQDALAYAPTAALSIGAQPTSEYDRWLAIPQPSGAAPALPSLPFAHPFAHHEQARAWAELLRGVTTLAIDGSQLLPWRDASTPLALTQVGIFENPHQPSLPYLKDVATELLTPDDLLAGEASAPDIRAGEALGYSTQIVHLRRFELEARTMIERMRHHAPGAAPGARQPSIVAFYDGSLIVSFALKMPPEYRERYVAAARALLDASAAYRVPLIGYIDTSYARDLLTMLNALANPGDLPETHGIFDALLWQGALAWGDRTPAFISARDDLERMGYADQRDAVAFVYFQSALDRPPARLEFPRWLLDDGLLDATIDIVRAETIAGNGYPYPIEAADAVAVISTADRAQFYALFQQFAEREGLAFSFSRKALSKTRRRI